MSKQRTVSSFFKPLASKRRLSGGGDSPRKARKSDDGTKEQAAVNDNRKSDDGTTEPAAIHNKSKHPTPENDGVEMTGSLSPQQKSRMEENKIQAKLKLLTKKTDGLVPPTFGPTWYSVLEEEFSKPYFVEISKFLQKERQSHTIFPPPEDVFSFSNMCDFKQVKVVILGQDPYHHPNQAHGLCFSVRKGVRVPPSLLNMYKELGNDIPDFLHPGHGFLEGWAKQGVLLLNAVLTVRAYSPNSHKGHGWENFTDAVISKINQQLNGVVFLLWGKDAQKKGSHIDKKKHLVLTTVHPSPLSANRGFLGCKHFSQCNDYLKNKNKKPINWCHLP